MSTTTKLLIGFTFGFMSYTNQATAQIAVIVNQENPIESLSMTDLNRIFIGDLLRWDQLASKTFGPVSIVDYKKISPASRVFFNKVCGLSPKKIRMLWMGKMLNGDFQSLPIGATSDSEVIRMIKSKSRSIAFMPLGNLDTREVKILKIDGREVGHEGYPLN